MIASMVGASATSITTRWLQRHRNSDMKDDDEDQQLVVVVVAD